jgi:hypothetical protein
MGVKGFTKVVSSTDVTLKDLKNQTLAVDGSLELYRAALGMASVKGLTDGSGKPTLHVSVILANIIKYKQNKIDTIWVFDFDPEKLANSECHNPLKLQELEERRKKRDAAKKKILELKKQNKNSDSDSDLFSDIDDEEETKKAIQKQEKIAFTLQSWMVNDIKLILNLLDIKWVESPKGVEAECLAARLTHDDVAEADAVLSSDADALLFGASTLIKKNTRTKKYNRFYLDEVLEKHNITQKQLIQMGIVLGTDMYKDKVKKLFFRIGPKTVIGKLKSGVLKDKFKDPEVKKAMEHFQEICDIDSLEWHNEDEDSFTNIAKAKQLLEWLVKEKNFNRSRIRKQISKIIKLD